MNLDCRVLQHCGRRQTIISSSHQGLVALLWTPPEDLLKLFIAHMCCVLCGGWRYFLPYMRPEIGYPLTRLGLGAIPHPKPTVAVSHQNEHYSYISFHHVLYL